VPLALAGPPLADPIPLACGIVLDLAKNCSFLNWKLTLVPINPYAIYGWALDGHGKQGLAIIMPQYIFNDNRRLYSLSLKGRLVVKYFETYLSSRSGSASCKTHSAMVRSAFISQIRPYCLIFRHRVDLPQPSRIAALVRLPLLCKSASAIIRRSICLQSRT
jgi:hypothetical protein